jgi:zinc protease
MSRLILSLLLLCCSSAFAAGLSLPPYERFALDNGATVLLLRKPDVPMVAVQVLVRGGALADAPGKEGSASLLADLLTKGAGERDARAFAEAIDSVGATLTFDTWREAISAEGDFLAQDTDLMLELVADALQRPTLAPDEFAKLRTRAIQRISTAKDGDPRNLVSLYASAWLYRDHPYGRAQSGDERSLAALTIEDLRAFYRDQMGGDRTTIAIAGDFDVAQMRARVQRAFGGWRKAQGTLPETPAKLRENGRRVLLVDKPGATQTYFWVGNVGASQHDPARAAQDLVQTVFGGRFTSMLNTELRIRTGLSYSANSHFDRLQQTGHWEMGSFTQTETTIQALDLMLATLDQLHESGLEPTMVESGKSYVQGQYPLALETAAQWATQLATLEFYGLDRRYIDDYSKQLGAVTPADAKKVIDDVFPPSTALAIVVIGNAGAIRDSLRKYGPITEMKLADPTFAPVSTE